MSAKTRDPVKRELWLKPTCSYPSDPYGAVAEKDFLTDHRAADTEYTGEHVELVRDMPMSPDKLADAYGCVGIQAIKPGDLDGAIKEMIAVKRPVLFDCRVAALENCFPMIPSGKAHNEMLLPAEANDEATAAAFASGKALV